MGGSGEEAGAETRVNGAGAGCGMEPWETHPGAWGQGAAPHLCMHP